MVTWQRDRELEQRSGGRLSAMGPLVRKRAVPLPRCPSQPSEDQAETAPRLRGPQDHTLAKARQTLSWKRQHCPFSVSLSQETGNPHPSPSLPIVNKGSKDEELERQRCGKHPAPGDQGLEGAGETGDGKKGPRKPLCMDVSFLGRKQEGEIPWATCMIEQGKNWVKGLSGIQKGDKQRTNRPER